MAIILGNEFVPVNSTITAIMVRELLEGCMFCVTHIGAVLKSDTLTREQKRKCLKVLIPSILIGVSMGLIIAICIGISLVFIVGDNSNTAFGVEVGEAVSKLIGALFVTDLMFKIPKWFKISNYQSEESKVEGYVDNEAYNDRWAIGLSLWWNVLRESIEGGTLTAIAVIFSDSVINSLGYSVLVALMCSLLLALIFGFGAKYVSVKLFGVIAAFLAQLLAMGLWTGTTRAWEEVAALNANMDEDGGTTGLIYNYDGTSYGNSLTVLEFLGFSSNLTVLTLTVWLLALVILTFMQFWHNYLGYPFIPSCLAERAKLLCRRDQHDKGAVIDKSVSIS